MEITNVEAIPVTVDIRDSNEDWGVSPYVAGYMTQTKSSRLVIKLDTDQGIIGWGETAIGPGTSMAGSVVRDIILPDILGLKVWDFEELLNKFQYPYFSITPYLAGVEMAMWDAFGKLLGEPISKFIGGMQNDWVDVAYCVGISDPEESAEKAEWAKKQGFQVLKTKGGLDIDQDVNRLIAMNEAVDGEMKFRLDGNQTMGFDATVETLSRLENNNVHLQYIEQPLRIDNIGGYRVLRNRSMTPIAVNEDAYHPRNIFELVKSDAIDTVVMDLIPAGGIHAAKKMLGLYADAGVSVAHHSSFDLGIKTAAVLQFVASSSTINLPPDRVNYTLLDDVINPVIKVENGRMQVPDSPGLGIQIDEHKLAELQVEEAESIRYEPNI
jgi:L-alanine-DL-glutamate epimerase-like enolase superfamily enzyme